MEIHFGQRFRLLANYLLTHFDSMKMVLRNVRGTWDAHFFDARWVGAMAIYLVYFVSITIDEMEDEEKHTCVWVLQFF